MSIFTNADVFIHWSLALFLLALEITILVLIWTRTIKLDMLISEKDGTASLSRFQFLIFTFAIVSIFIIMAFTGTTVQGTGTTVQWPTVPAGVLGLMGISGGSYVVSKGIQKGAERTEAATETEGGGRWVR